MGLSLPTWDWGWEHWEFCGVKPRVLGDGNGESCIDKYPYLHVSTATDMYINCNLQHAISELRTNSHITRKYMHVN